MNYKAPGCAGVWDFYQKGLDYKAQIGLFETVEKNEAFFIGDQWRGVVSNGLPTPVFNFLKRVTLFEVSSIAADSVKLQASPLLSAPGHTLLDLERISGIVNRSFDGIFEGNSICQLLREYLRNAAVDGDGCLYTYFDPTIENGQAVKGDIVTEIVENTRVFFGNPNDRRVQSQPYIILSSRRLLEEVRRKAAEKGLDPELVRADSDENNDRYYALTDDKVTVLLYLFRDPETGRVQMFECTRELALSEVVDTELNLYPICWINWDYIQNSYHGQALISGLIPNQVFINKLFAMSMISLMTTAYPKIIYDKTRIEKWDSKVGAAIGVCGGDMGTVAKIMDPAQISPQIAQFISLAVQYTQEFLGATDAAMGNVKPDNTSAILALQRAASIPLELVKQNLHKSIEDLGRIYLDFMSVYYGRRTVELAPGELELRQKERQNEIAEYIMNKNAKPEEEAIFSFAPDPKEKQLISWDFDQLRDIPLSLKLDVGASAYWSEVAAMQTLDNLLALGKIDMAEYLERIPAGYISNKQELLEKSRQAAQPEVN